MLRYILRSSKGTNSGTCSDARKTHMRLCAWLSPVKIGLKPNSNTLNESFGRLSTFVQVFFVVFSFLLSFFVSFTSATDKFRSGIHFWHKRKSEWLRTSCKHYAQEIIHSFIRYKLSLFVSSYILSTLTLLNSRWYDSLVVKVEKRIDTFIESL